MSLASIILLSLLLGMRHATDADHVVAISTIVARTKSLLRCAWIGTLWGFGHTASILFIGGGIILFKWIIPARLGLAMEASVGLMLVLLGALNVSGLWKHHHSAEAWIASRARPIFVGLIHGMAGSAAAALLVLSAIHDTTIAMAYLAVFGLGTILGMMLITLAMALPVRKVLPKTQSAVRLASGWLSIAFGLFLVYHNLFAKGFFTHPIWRPE